MTRLLRLTLFAQLLFFAVWGASLLRAHRTADIVWLETTPIDPRDLLAGHYVALRYAIESPPGKCNDGGARPGTVYVRLAPSGDPVATRDGSVTVWAAVACSSTQPETAPQERWIAGQRNDRGHVTYGIERFYLPEASGLRAANSGQVVAKVSIERFGARIVDLVERTPPIGPAR